MFEKKTYHFKQLLRKISFQTSYKDEVPIKKNLNLSIKWRNMFSNTNCLLIEMAFRETNEAASDQNLKFVSLRRSTS